MPARPSASLPDLPGLPPILRQLVTFTLSNPRVRADHLLVLANAVQELEEQLPPGFPTIARSYRRLVEELRHRAPEYA